MFSDLPKLFDRDFAVAYALPASLILLFSLTLLSAFSVYQLPASAEQVNPLIGTAVIAFAAWAGGILLSAMNRLIIRFAEGYGGRLNPAYYLLPLQRWRYRRLFQQILSAFEKTEIEGEGSKAHIHFQKLMLKFSQEYPHLGEYPESQVWVLPTVFGNVVRSFEYYPNKVYGADGIEVWSRLLTVIPTDYQNLLNAAKAQMDMWLNLWLMCFVIFFQYLFLVLVTQTTPLYGTPIISLIFAIFFTKRAKGAAIRWGKLFKAAYDVYLPELAKKLGYKLPTNPEMAFRFWQHFSYVILYRDRDSLLELSRYTYKNEIERIPEDLPIHERLKLINELTQRD